MSREVECPKSSSDAFDADTFQGFRDVLLYTGYARVIERKVASTKDIEGYWESIPPIWQVRWAGVHCGIFPSPSLPAALNQ